MTVRDVVIAEARLTVLAWMGEAVDDGLALRNSLRRLRDAVCELDGVEKPKTAQRRRDKRR
jgi:hypothetical protein